MPRIRFSLYTLMLSALFIGALSTFVVGFPAWKLVGTIENCKADSAHKRFSPDGRKLILSHQAGNELLSLAVLDLNSGKFERIYKIMRNETPIGAGPFAPDPFAFAPEANSGSRMQGYIGPASLVRGTYADGRWVKTMFPNKPAPPPEYESVKNAGCVAIKYEFPSFAISPSLQFLAFRDVDSTLEIRDVLSNETLRSFEQANFGELAFDSESAWLIAENIEPAHTLSVFSVRGGDETTAANDANRYLYTGPGTLLSIPLECDRENPRLEGGGAEKMGAELCAAPAKRLFARERRTVYVFDSGKVVEYNWASGEQKALAQLPLIQTLYAPALSPDASRVAFFDNGQLRVCRVAENRAAEIHAWKLDWDSRDLAFSKDGERLFLTGGGRFRELDIASGAELSSLEATGETVLTTDGERVLAVGSPSKLYIRNHAGGWRGQFARGETWLLILFGALLLARMAGNLAKALRREKPAQKGGGSGSI